MKITILSIYPKHSYLGKLLTEVLVAAFSGRSAKVTKRNIGLIVLCVSPSACVWGVSQEFFLVWAGSPAPACAAASPPLYHQFGKNSVWTRVVTVAGLSSESLPRAWRANMDRSHHWWCCSGESRAELVLPGILAWLQSSPCAPPRTRVRHLPL